MEIEEWIKSVVEGPGGFIDWEEREVIAFPGGREKAIARFVIRCLANKDCKGSDKVLLAILERRNETATRKNPLD